MIIYSVLPAIVCLLHMCTHGEQSPLNKNRPCLRSNSLSDGDADGGIEHYWYARGCISTVQKDDSCESR